MVATGTLAGLIAFVVASVLFLGQVVGPLLECRDRHGRDVRPHHGVDGRYLLGAEPARPAPTGSLRSTAGPRDRVPVAGCDRRSGGFTAAGWTVSGLAVAGLVAHADTSARAAARQVAVRLLVGDVAVWAAVALMYAQGVSDRSELSGAGWIVPALLAVGGLIRSALVPAWRWLPLTAEAPSPVSALLHAGVVNRIGLLAVLWWPLFEAAPGVLLALLVVGGITAVLGTAAMRVRPDVRASWPVPPVPRWAT